MRKSQRIAKRARIVAKHCRNRLTWLSFAPTMRASRPQLMPKRRGFAMKTRRYKRGLRTQKRIKFLATLAMAGEKVN
jgi:hypothetical protein